VLSRSRFEIKHGANLIVTGCILTWLTYLGTVSAYHAMPLIHTSVCPTFIFRLHPTGTTHSMTKNIYMPSFTPFLMYARSSPLARCLETLRVSSKAGTQVRTQICYGYRGGS
jgi:hypothetical protein